MKYLIEIDGGNLGSCYYEAPDMLEAIEYAEEWTRDGDWDTSEGTIWCDVRITEVREEDPEVREITVAVHPDEPDCDGEHDHDWQSPHSVVGGIKGNPGVQGHGGGVIITVVCRHCGRYRITDTWAQRRDTGEQGLRSVRYEEADDASLAYVQREREEERMKR